MLRESYGTHKCYGKIFVKVDRKKSKTQKLLNIRIVAKGSN